MKFIYATVITQGFEVQALALARSIITESKTSEFIFFCLDEVAICRLRPLLPERCSIVEYDSFKNETLDRLKLEREPASFCWTCKPVILKYIQKTFPNIDWSVYVDGDMLAFSDPNERLLQAGDCSVVLAPHAFRYFPFIGTETMVGSFNAGYFAVKNNETGKEILNWWQDKCLEECPTIPNPNAYGDQKYLDLMADKFKDNISIGFPVTDFAPWNVGQDILIAHDDGIYFQTQKVQIFHFQGFKFANENFVDLYAGNMRLSKSIKKLIFSKYRSYTRAAYADLKEQTDYSMQSRYSAIYLLKCMILSLLGRHNIAKW